MKKLLLAALLLLPAPPALAGVACTLPFTLTNGTIADATQVMANYNALVTCLASAAAAGINADITALTGLTTPLAPSQGGTTSFAGGTSSGTNTIVITATVPNSFTLNAGYCVMFVAGGSNTGAVTLAVGATAAKAVLKPAQAGPVALIGGEIVAGQLALACYDGSQYQINPQASYASLIAKDQVVSGGANVAAVNLGTISTGTLTIDCGLGPLQFYVNAGGHALSQSVQDGSCQILIINSSSAGSISTGASGIFFGSYSGDPYTTANGVFFIFNYTRIDGVALGFFKRVN